MTDASEPGETAPAKTPKEANLRPPWKKGQSGNPKGRPKGSRNKLSESFINDALEAWNEGGKGVLSKMMAERPGDFAKMIAGLVPKEFDVNANVALPPMQMQFVAPDLPLPSPDRDDDDGAD